MSNIAEIVFWVAFALLFYTYLGYPVLTWMQARLFARPVQKEPIVPPISLVIVAYNEEGNIQRRIENILKMDYPREKMEIVIASDGSDDGTAAAVRSFAGEGVKLLDFPRRRGKPAVLNEVIPLCQGDIVVLSDAIPLFDPQAVRELAADFADEQVGSASGELRFLPGEGHSTFARGFGFYWKYENFLRRTESMSHSMVGATGPIYAIRKELFEPIPEDTLLDDVLIPLRIMAKGYRAIFDPAAVARREIAQSERAEAVRKRRTIAGNFQIFCRHRSLVNPFRSRLWFRLISHKGLRLAAPVFLLVLLLTNLFLLDVLFFRVALGLQLVFYACALFGCLLRESPAGRRIFSVPYAFLILNLFTIMAFSDHVRGRQTALWQKANKED